MLLLEWSPAILGLRVFVRVWNISFAICSSTTRFSTKSNYEVNGKTTSMHQPFGDKHVLTQMCCWNENNCLRLGQQMNAAVRKGKPNDTIMATSNAYVRTETIKTWPR